LIVVTEPGDAAAFARVALPHLDAAANLARWLVRDPTLAEDVVQDAMLRGLTYIRSFRGDNPRAWLLQIVRSVAYTRLAARRDAAEVSLDPEPAAEIPDGADNPEASLAHRERCEALDQALAALPAELREIIVLRELEDMSYRDIARITGAPIGTVMSRLWRARRALRLSTEEPVA
jgi:RNA polymerase sigma-70 factor (ECF subfamily)